MRDGSGGSTRDGVGKTRGAALGDDYSVGAGGERRSNDGSEIVRVFHSVEQHDQAFFAATGGFVSGLEYVFEGCGRACCDQANDSLVVFRIGEAIELTAILESHGNIFLPRELHDLFNARI